MITEDYCSYEVSKLLKEKGFDWMCNGYYNKDDEDSEPYFGDGEGADNWNNQAPSVKDLWCSAPTHQMAMKWLRDYPNYIFIGIENQYLFSYEVYHYHIRCKAPKREIDKFSEVDYRTYEEAVEAALKYCLTNLI